MDDHSIAMVDELSEETIREMAQGLFDEAIGVGETPETIDQVEFAIAVGERVRDYLMRDRRLDDPEDDPDPYSTAVIRIRNALRAALFGDNAARMGKVELASLVVIKFVLETDRLTV